MSAPVQSLHPDIDLVQDLRMDADMLKDGHQQNLTKLWHSDAVKQAALNALKAADTIEQYRADQTRDESVIATLKTRAEQAERAVDVLEAALEFYADPFAWKKKHDPDNDVRVPDFYSETSFGDTAIAALSNGEVGK